MWIPNPSLAARTVADASARYDAVDFIVDRLERLDGQPVAARWSRAELERKIYEVVRTQSSLRGPGRSPLALEPLDWQLVAACEPLRAGLGQVWLTVDKASPRIWSVDRELSYRHWTSWTSWTA